MWKRKEAELNKLRLFVCGSSLTSNQLFRALYRLPQGYAFTLVLCHRGSDQIYEMRCLLVAVGLYALFIVLRHWDMSYAHMVPYSVTILTPG